LRGLLPTNGFGVESLKLVEFELSIGLDNKMVVANFLKIFWNELWAALRGELASPARLDNFTPRAQQAIQLARKEAVRLSNNFVGTEHLLLGLIRLDKGVAIAVLRKLGIDLQVLRNEVETLVRAAGPDHRPTDISPFTPRTKRVLAMASKEALALHHTYLGTEHILLALLREGDGLAGRVLKSLRVDLERTRQEVIKELDPNFGGGNVEEGVAPHK
jgi:ATP-dependent Clp protease ATP-binding subunit ClpC